MLTASLLLFGLSSLPLIFARDSCKCGFSVNSTSSPTYQIFEDYLETDFTTLQKLQGWVPQDWTINATEARGPFGKNASSRNIELSQEGLKLWVRQPIEGVIPMAEVQTKRTDMLYGSFRMRARMSGVNGTCGAMFWYHNNTQEIDMEFLSKQFNETAGSNINLVVQSPESQANGFNAIFTPGFSLPHLPFRPDREFHTYRFDWTPEEIAFYADDVLLHVMTENIPDSGGHFVFNHWSNGDPGWSAGPPLEDSFLTVSHAYLYFNSSSSKSHASFKKGCTTLNTTEVCEIPSAKAESVPRLMPPRTGDDDEGGGISKTTIYIIIGVVVGVVIILFIGCMMTIKTWIRLKNRIFGGGKKVEKGGSDSG